MKRSSDENLMSEALRQAKLARKCSEVPVGAVIVRDSKIIAADHNRCEELKDPTAHAEILVIQHAARMLGGWRLAGCTIYVTLEPCVMCAGAMVQARVSRLVYGASDPKGGAAGTLYNITGDQRLNHRLMVTERVLEDKCSKLLQAFFQELRG